MTKPPYTPVNPTRSNYRGFVISYWLRGFFGDRGSTVLFGRTLTELYGRIDASGGPAR